MKNDDNIRKIWFWKTSKNLSFISQNKYLFLNGHYSTIFLFEVLYLDNMWLKFQRLILKNKKVMNF